MSDTAGQLTITAHMQKSLGYDTFSMCGKHPFRYPFPIDYTLPEGSSVWVKSLGRLKGFFNSAESFDVFHYYSGTSLVPFEIDAQYEKLRGKRVVVEFFGSEARLPEIESKRNPYYVNSYNESEARNISRLKRWADITGGEVIFPDHTFNSFFEPYFDRIHIVGQRIDCRRYEVCFPDPDVKRIRIMHAPSQHAFKGTAYLEKAVERLQCKGLDFDYVRVSGVSNVEAMEQYRRADLIVDQLCGGSHGVLACEAMALGKPVICHILREHYQGYPEGFPVINANPDTIETVLEELIASPQALHDLGKKSRLYVERVHDVHNIAQNLIQIYNRNFPYGSKQVIDWRTKSF